MKILSSVEKKRA